MDKTRFILVVIITLLVAGNMYFATMYFLTRLDLARTQSQIRGQEANEKAVYFAKLFIDKVLMGEGEVDFEDRLKLENSVRDINDQKIFDQWQAFLNSQSDGELQDSAGRLLEFLFDKIAQ